MTKETEVEVAPEPNLVSNEREEDTEIVETVELEAEPEVREDIEDVIASQEDPRAEIYKRQKEKREQEIEDQTGGFSESEPEIHAEDEENAQIAVENEDSAAIIESTPDDESATPPDVDEMVTVKILGDFRQVPKSKVEAQGGVENFQIRVAAQEQMERNAHEAKALEARKAALDEQERRMSTQQPAIPATDSQHGQNPGRSTQLDGQTLEAKARQYQEAVYDDSEEAPSILADMISTASNSGQTFDENAFRTKVKEDVLAEQRQAKIVKASHALIDAHPELNARDPSFDPRMFNTIDGETMTVEREHPEWEPEQVVQEAYDRIRKWKGDTKSETMSEKQAEKKAMTRPRVGTQRFAPPPPPPRQTNSDYVAQERKRRGLE